MAMGKLPSSLRLSTQPAFRPGSMTASTMSDLHGMERVLGSLDIALPLVVLPLVVLPAVALPAVALPDAPLGPC
jgi:hypothetical protein